jgi:hypothetical protein
MPQTSNFLGYKFAMNTPKPLSVLDAVQCESFCSSGCLGVYYVETGTGNYCHLMREFVTLALSYDPLHDQTFACSNLPTDYVTPKSCAAPNTWRLVQLGNQTVNNWVLGCGVPCRDGFSTLLIDFYYTCITGPICPTGYLSSTVSGSVCYKSACSPIIIPDASQSSVLYSTTNNTNYYRCPNTPNSYLMSMPSQKTYSAIFFLPLGLYNMEYISMDVNCVPASGSTGQAAEDLLPCNDDNAYGPSQGKSHAVHHCKHISNPFRTFGHFDSPDRCYRQNFPRRRVCCGSRSHQLEYGQYSIHCARNSKKC